MRRWSSTTACRLGRIGCRRAPAADRRIDLDGRAVIPGFVDSHSHLVFAGDRSTEFAARMAGEPYDGGGIATTVAATRAAADERLRTLLTGRIAELRAQGTTTVEIKSGYGLTVADEARALRIAAEFTAETTFLGAHVVPPEWRRPDRLPGPRHRRDARRRAPYARWVDVFCEPARRRVQRGRGPARAAVPGRSAGWGSGSTATSSAAGPGVQLAVELGAASVDHCTYLSDADIDALAAAADTTVATLLPGVEFSTRSPYPDGRRLLDAGVTVALATDCNPGSSYTSSMPF